jgi:PST family polysaccharide transporter
LRRAIVSATRLLALVSWPVYVGAAAAAPELVPFSIGEKWIPSVSIVQAFMLASAIAVLMGSLSTAITAVGAVRWRLVLELLVAGTTLAAILVALPRGVVVVAWAYTAAVLCVLPLVFWTAARLLPFTLADYLRQTAVPAAASLVMACAVIGLRHVGASTLGRPALLAAEVALGSAVYVGTLFLIAPAWTREAVGDMRLAFRRVPARVAWEPGNGPA